MLADACLHTHTQAGGSELRAVPLQHLVSGSGARVERPREWVVALQQQDQWTVMQVGGGCAVCADRPSTCLRMMSVNVHVFG
jgi:hypothetical protein